jgi:hypothetical protein
VVMSGSCLVRGSASSPRRCHRPARARRHKSQIADRAAETRKKNEEAKAAAKASAAGTTGATGTTGGGAPGG